jgi:superfamily I DNA/RNA helicase
VALATIHAAKGLEWRYVWLVGALEGQLPHHKSLEADPAGGVADERRIAYVAFTRAEDELRISAPLRNRSGRDCEPSRFIAEAGLAR